MRYYLCQQPEVLFIRQAILPRPRVRHDSKLHQLQRRLEAEQGLPASLVTPSHPSQQQNEKIYCSRQRSVRPK